MDPMTSTYIWLAIFGFSSFVFFAIAVWVIIRGGKDVLEIFRMSDREVEKLK